MIYPFCFPAQSFSTIQNSRRFCDGSAYREVAKRIRVEAELLQEFHIMQKMACKFLLYCYNNTVTFFRLVGQVVKTPPSQGGIRGSIPLRAVP